MKPCEDWHRKIVRVLDNEAGDEDKREVAEHLHVCASCRGFHEKFIRIRSEFRSVVDPKLPTGIRDNLVKEIGMQASCSSSTERTYGDSVMLRYPGWKGYLSAAAVVIAGIGFLGGRLSAPPTLPKGVDDAPQVAAVSGDSQEQGDGVTVPSDLVAWLDAARLFRQLGMEERMADAVENAGRLLPSNDVAASGALKQSIPPADDNVFENQNNHSILAEILRPPESVGTVSGIMAQVFGGYNYESEMD